MAANAIGRSLLIQGNRAGPELARTVKFPSLIKAEHGYDLNSVDRDVLDAARLGRTQINAYLEALEGAVAAGAYTEEQLAKDRLNYQQEAKVVSTERLTRRQFLLGHLRILAEPVDIFKKLKFSMQISAVYNCHAFIFNTS
ncbi:hypothetical protein COCHEDRAFT_1151506 [Bipolaris maydis C5]|uniref:Uncharacterized protein n=1 Tax=Cochliobolus heterostrophus (strain C5 / ATCC 48332 / race O) TaxID=701091 RepID=M2UWL9_COCH5|nr:hypothetical protein COCHEDRAFT_1151506 [Bipolaris maydis C5]